MVDSFATEMDDIMKQHAAEVEGLRQHVLGLHNSSRALEERARVAEEYAQMLEHEVATSKIIVSSHKVLGRLARWSVGRNGRPLLVQRSIWRTRLHFTLRLNCIDGRDCRCAEAWPLVYY